MNKLFKILNYLLTTLKIHMDKKQCLKNTHINWGL